MKKFLWVVCALFSLMIFAAVGFSTSQGDVEKGKEVYAKEKCQMCHSIAGKGNKRWPLDGVGSHLDEPQIRKWIKTPKEMDVKTVMKAYPGISDADLADLTAYLISLKK